MRRWPRTIPKGVKAPGETVVVEYAVDDPTLARISGQRLTPAGRGASFVVIFPLSGVLRVLFGWVPRRRFRIDPAKPGRGCFSLVRC